MLHELLAACTAASCPVCTVANRSVERFFGSLSYENTNDPVIRSELRAFRGFCNHHAWQYAEQHDALGASIVYRDILRDVLRALTDSVDRPADLISLAAARVTRNRSGSSTKALVRALSPCGTCLACHRDERTSGDAVHVLATWSSAPDVMFALAASGGMCFPHLSRALSGERRLNPRDALIAVHLATCRLAHDRVAAGDIEAGAVLLAGNLRGATMANAAVDVRMCRTCDARTRLEQERVAERVSADGSLSTLCYRHVWMAVRGKLRPEPMLRALDTQSALQAILGPRDARRSRVAGYTCSVCTLVREGEGFLAEDVEDASLCLPHLVRAVNAGVGGASAAQQAWLKAGRALEGELAEFIRKSDYRFRAEPRGSEGNAWLRAIALIAGAPGTSFEVRTHGHLAATH